MFFIKAVRSNGDYSLYEAVGVSVHESTADGVNPPGMPPFVKADWDVYIYDKPDTPSCITIRVGWGSDHYVNVYVMNDRGKTIDTVSRAFRNMNVAAA